MALWSFYVTCLDGTLFEKKGSGNEKASSFMLQIKSKRMEGADEWISLPKERLTMLTMPAV